MLGAVVAWLTKRCSTCRGINNKEAGDLRASADTRGTEARQAPVEVDATCSPLQCKYIVGVADLRFEWDERKNRSNRQKHGVSFEEAQTVFLDDAALLIDDPDHSDDEDRFVLLGLSSSLRTLVVCHCYRKGASIIRIITARKADRSETSLYSQRVPK